MSEYATIYRDGEGFVAVLTGMPEDAVEVGIGGSPGAARLDLEPTPIQSVGRDGGLSAALRWAQGARWFSDVAKLERLPGGAEE